MKKTKNIIYFFVLASLLLALTSSCHKYPEDPFLSLKRPFERLNGTWKFTSYQINGFEHGHDFDSLLIWTTITDCSVVLDIQKGNRFLCTIRDANGAEPGQCHVFGCYIDRDKNNRNMFFDVGTENFAKFFWKCTSGYGVAWEIRELYSKDLHLRNGNADIYLKKQ